MGARCRRSTSSRGEFVAVSAPAATASHNCRSPVPTTTHTNNSQQQQDTHWFYNGFIHEKARKADRVERRQTKTKEKGWNDNTYVPPVPEHRKHQYEAYNDRFLPTFAHAREKPASARLSRLVTAAAAEALRRQRPGAMALLTPSAAAAAAAATSRPAQQRSQSSASARRATSARSGRRRAGDDDAQRDAGTGVFPRPGTVGTHVGGTNNSAYVKQITDYSLQVMREKGTLPGAGGNEPVVPPVATGSLDYHGHQRANRVHMQKLAASKDST
jgi:hypothetical protein